MSMAMTGVGQAEVTGPVTPSYILQEDGIGHILDENGVDAILAEN